MTMVVLSPRWLESLKGMNPLAEVPLTARSVVSWLNSPAGRPGYWWEKVDIDPTSADYGLVEKLRALSPQQAFVWELCEQAYVDLVISGSSLGRLLYAYDIPLHKVGHCVVELF